MRSRRISIVLTLVAGLAFTALSWAQVPTRAEVDASQDVILPEDPAAVLAVVGKSHIVQGDLMPKVEARIQEVLSKTEQKVPEDQLRFARLNMIRGLLSQAIQNKMMRESFLIEQVGTESADKRDEADAKLTARARQMFFENELPELKEQYETQDVSELDKLLRKKGSSLAARQRDFVDQMLGHLYIRGQMDRDPSVSIAEIAEYYQAHLDEYERPTRARWEQLSVLYSNFDSREEAKQAIWDMGREAYFGGSMQAVARSKSQEPFANKGGLHEWTAQGALASDAIDEKLFSIPLNAMSEIISDDVGFHIIRVLDREEAGLIPLSEVQDDIRGEIRKEKIAQSQREVMENMQVRIPVWSFFPEDTPGAKPLPLSISRRYQSPKNR